MDDQDNMCVSSILSLGFMAAGIFAQDVIEPANFNVTEALLDNGVNISAIPDLAGLAERSLFSGCSIAVSVHQDGSIFGRSTKYQNAHPCANLL